MLPSNDAPMDPGAQTPDGPPSPSPSTDPQALISGLQRKRRSVGLSRRGCGLGCLALTLLMLLGLASFLSWLLAESPLPVAESLVGPETAAFSIVHLSDEDPGVRALLQTTLRRLRSTFVDDSTLPEPVKKTLGKLAPQNVQAFLPLQLVATRDTLAGEADPVETIVVSFGRFKGLSDMMFASIVASKDEASKVIRYRDAEVLVVAARSSDDITAVGHLRSSFIFSSRVEGVQRAIDRLSNPDGTFGGNADAAAMYRRLDARQDLLGIITSQDGQIRRVLEGMRAAQSPRDGAVLITPAFVEAASAAVRQIGWEMDVLSQSDVTLHLLIECRGASEAARVAAFLEQIAREAKQAGAIDASTLRTTGSVVEATLRSGWLQKLLGPPGREPAPTPGTPRAPGSPHA